MLDTLFIFCFHPGWNIPKSTWFRNNGWGSTCGEEPGGATEPGQRRHRPLVGVRSQRIVGTLLHHRRWEARLVFFLLTIFLIICIPSCQISINALTHGGEETTCITLLKLHSLFGGFFPMNFYNLNSIRGSICITPTNLPSLWRFWLVHTPTQLFSNLKSFARVGGWVSAIDQLVTGHFSIVELSPENLISFRQFSTAKNVDFSKNASCPM